MSSDPYINNEKPVLKIERQFFEDWSKTYDEKRNKSSLRKVKEIWAVLIKKYLRDTHSDYLEIGLGTGESFEINSYYFKNSYGMDISEGMVRKSFSKQKIKKNLFVGDSCKLPLRSESMDFIICQDVLEHVPYQTQLLLEIRRVLRKNGIGIITTPNPLWAPVLYIAEKLNMKVEEGVHKFVFLPTMAKETLSTNCTILDSSPFMMLPIKTRIDKLVEPLRNSFFSRFGVELMCIIKK